MIGESRSKPNISCWCEIGSVLRVQSEDVIRVGCMRRTSGHEEDPVRGGSGDHHGCPEDADVALDVRAACPQAGRSKATGEDIAAENDTSE